MRELVISERAEADLREIWLYSFDNWGEAQADRYLDELDAGLRKCGVEPEGGKQREAAFELCEHRLQSRDDALLRKATRL